MEAQPVLPTFEWPALTPGPAILCFELPGKPPHKARHRSRLVIGRELWTFAGGLRYLTEAATKRIFIQQYPDSDTEAHEKALAELAGLYMRGRAPSQQPIVMLVHAFRSIPESWSKRDKEKALAGAIVPTSKPDADNYLKFVKDALNGVAYADDSQVVDARVIKRYSDEPALRVEIRELVAPTA